MTDPISRNPAPVPNLIPQPTLDNLLQVEQFDSQSKAVSGSGGAASLINIQKDVDTLERSGGKGITQGDLKSDLEATGLSSGDADNYASSLLAAAGSSDTGELQNELASIFQSQGGLDADHAQGLANTFVGMVGGNGDTVATYQSETQAQDSGVSFAESAGRDEPSGASTSTGDEAGRP